MFLKFCNYLGCIRLEHLTRKLFLTIPWNIATNYKLQKVLLQEFHNLTQQKSSLVLEDANLDKQIAECKKQVIDLSLQSQNLDDQFKLAETQIGQNEQNSKSFKKLQGDLMEKETLLSNVIAKREFERELQEIAKKKVIIERKDDLAKLLQEVEEAAKHYEHAKQANHTKNSVLKMKLFKLEIICKKLGTEKDNLVQQHLNLINNRTESKQLKKVSFQSYVTQHCDETDSVMTQDMENQGVNAAKKSKQ